MNGDGPQPRMQPQPVPVQVEVARLNGPGGAVVRVVVRSATGEFVFFLPTEAAKGIAQAMSAAAGGIVLPMGPPPETP